MDIEFAKSKSGHDKNQIYFIMEETDTCVSLVNGTTKPLHSPKVKNRKHIQIIKRIPAEVKQLLEQEVTDLTIKRAIKEYQRISKQEEI